MLIGMSAVFVAMAFDLSAAQVGPDTLSNATRSISVTIEVADNQDGEDARHFNAKTVLKGTFKKSERGWNLNFISQNVKNSGSPQIDDGMMLYNGPIKIQANQRFRPITIEDWPSVYRVALGNSESEGYKNGIFLGLDDATYAVRLFFQPLFYLSLPERLSLSEGEDLSSLASFSPETASKHEMRVKAIDRPKGEATVEWSEVTDDVALRDTLMNRVEKIEKAKGATVSRDKMRAGLNSLQMSQKYSCLYKIDFISEMVSSARCNSTLYILDKNGKYTKRTIEYKIQQQIN